MTSSPIYTKLYITKPRLVILILNNSTEVQFHNSTKENLWKVDGWGRMALVDCSKPRNKKTESWASYCMWPEHTVTYMPQLCVRKIKSSASSCKGPITLKICICKICKEKPLQNNCSSWNPFYLLVDLEGVAMDPAHCWIVVLIFDDLIYYLQIPLLRI